ncbi:MAG: nicotinate (nicotinamide) nucleotide adenylyltransferase [Campylobacterota bacterium]|nr:nicotinate (nicotinamide) nucleotide adenylyltransferase [Campylobacterota bacterium]
MNVALFGGSFDPPHNGHLSIINAALTQLDIDKLIIIPAYLNPFKTSSVAPAHLRLEWLQKITTDSRVEISDFEIKQERPVPSIESVRHFQEGVQTLYFIIGADNLANLSSWYAYEALDKAVTWVIASRDNLPIDTHYHRLHVDEPISSTQLRKRPKRENLPKEIATSITTYYKEYHAKTH